jgi:hypothetical protein
VQNFTIRVWGIGFLSAITARTGGRCCTKNLSVSAIRDSAIGTEFWDTFTEFWDMLLGQSRSVSISRVCGTLRATSGRVRKLFWVHYAFGTLSSSATSPESSRIPASPRRSSRHRRPLRIARTTCYGCRLVPGRGGEIGRTSRPQAGHRYTPSGRRRISGCPHSRAYVPMASGRATI